MNPRINIVNCNSFRIMSDISHISPTVKLAIFCALLLCFSQLIQINTTSIAFAARPSEKVVSIMVAGDSIGYNIKHERLSNLDRIIYNDTDIFIFNLEGVLTANYSLSGNEKSLEECKGFPSYQSTFVSQPTFVDYLKLAPVTIANLGNNHIFDCGKDGVQETKKILAEKDILSVGGGRNLKDACAPLFIQSNEDLGIVFLSYNFELEDLVSARPNRAGAASIDGCNHDIDQIRAENQADLIIASIHLGYWSPNVSEEQIRVVQHLFDSGIDIVIGHSPHMPQAIEKVTKKGGSEKLAFFSVGNFILRPDYIMPSQAHTTIVPRLDVNTDSNMINVTIYPVRIDNDGIPHLEEMYDNEIIAKISKASDKKFNTLLNIYENTGQISVNLH